MNAAIEKAIEHYSRHVLADEAERHPDSAERKRQDLEEAAAYLEAGQPLDDRERDVLKRAVSAYIGHLSRGGYSGGQAPSPAEIEGAHQALKELERPELEPADAFAPSTAPADDLGIER